MRHIFSREDVDIITAVRRYYLSHGKYTNSIEGSSEFYKFWEGEAIRSKYGIDVGGVHITGYHYFYLNYCPIYLVRSREVIVEGISRVVNERVLSFPDFWDGDYESFRYIEECERRGMHAVELKTRGRGYSYKGASMLVRNYFLYAGSKGYVYAYGEEYLQGDGILNKAWEMVSHIDNTTAWAKRKLVDTAMHIKSGYKVIDNGVVINRGYLSEIIGITIKGSGGIDKVRGKRGKLILWEESGSNPLLLQGIEVARASVEQSGVTFGLMVVFGTGGDDGEGLQGFEELYKNCRAYNFLSMDDYEVWWYNKKAGRGFFIGEQMNMSGYMDSYGNSDLGSAMEVELGRRLEKKEYSSNNSTYTRYIAEHPLEDDEALLRITGNIFPTELLYEQLSVIEGDIGLRGLGQLGWLDLDVNGTVLFRYDSQAGYIGKYPTPIGSNLNAGIMIWEHPMDNAPLGLYIAGLDPYDHDSSSVGSLGSLIVYKRFLNFETTSNLVVAEYTARPYEGADIFYENCRRLLIYYNATCLYENMLKGVFTYFKNKNSEYLLASQPMFLKDIISDSKVHREYGTHMYPPIKKFLEGKLRDYLIGEYSNGKKNLEKILSVPLLQELIAYNDFGNFDRVIAFMLVIGQDIEYYNYNIRNREQIIFDNFFSKPTFKYKTNNLI